MRFKAEAPLFFSRLKRELPHLSPEKCVFACNLRTLSQKIHCFSPSKRELPRFKPETTLRTHPAANLLQTSQNVLSGQAFAEYLEAFQKLLFRVLACAKVVELSV